MERETESYRERLREREFERVERETESYRERDVEREKERERVFITK